MRRTLSDFVGDWRIDRLIEDRRDGGQSQLTGLATFTADTKGVILGEKGVLTLPGGQQVAATRRYLWRAQADGIAVTFEDGAPFHVFDPTLAQPVARHDCAPDLYVVIYDFADWPAWRMTWAVKGPRKDYISVTDFRR